MVVTRKNKSQQVARRIREGIQRGQWSAGAQLPALRDLAGQFDSSVPTVQRAMRLLEDEGLVTCRPRMGAFVRGGHPSKARADALAHIGLIHTPQRSQRQGSDEWRRHILQAAEDELIGAGGFYLTRIGSGEADPEKNLRNIQMQVDQLAEQMAGAILFPHKTPHVVTLMEHLDRLGLPWVSINHPTEQVIHNFVSADNIAAGKTAGRCFLANGFEKIVILSGDLNQTLSWMHKALGLVQVYLSNRRSIRGIDYVASKTVGVEQDAYDAMTEYLRRHQPEAVFTTGDILAVGAMRALRDKGLRVPEDVSVVGSTGGELGLYSTPPLTVVSQPMTAMGQTAARMLLRMIQTGERRLPGKQLEGKLIVRESLKLSDEARQALTEEGIL